MPERPDILRTAALGLVGAATVTVGYIAARNAVASLAPAKAMLMDLATGAFNLPGRPNVGTYVPRGLRTWEPLDVLVYFRGWNGCIQNVIGAEDRPCRAGGATRRATRLASQVDSAKKSVFLLVPELRVDVEDGATGRLGENGGLRALLSDALSGSSRKNLSDVGTVSVMVAVSPSGNPVSILRLAPVFVRSAVDGANRFTQTTSPAAEPAGEEDS